MILQFGPTEVCYPVPKEGELCSSPQIGSHLTMLYSRGIDVRENPRESINWRHYRTGCPNYRVRWFPESDPAAGEPLYQVYCLMDTPPVTWDEQEKCLSSSRECWRIAEARRQRLGADIPVSSIKRRTSA